MKPSVIAIAALLAALTAVFLMSRRSGSAPVEAPTAAVVEAATAPKAVETPRKEVPAPVAPKRRGITACRYEDGAKADPAAPPQPGAAYRGVREAALAAWRGAKVTITRDDTTIHEVIAAIGRSTGLKVNLDPGVSASLSVSLSMTGTDGEEALNMISWVANLDWVIDGDGASWLVPKDKAAMYESAEAREVKALEGMEVSLRAEQATAYADPREGQIDGLLDGKPISVNLKDVGLNQAMGILCSLHSLPMNLDRANIPDWKSIKVSLELADATPRDALKALLEPIGLDFVVEGGGIVVSTKEGLAAKAAARLAAKEKTTAKEKAVVAAEADVLSKTVALDGNALAIRDVAERISKALGIGYVIDPATWNRAARYGFDGEPHTLREIFAALAKGAPVRVAYREGKLWFLSASSGK